MKKLSLYFLVLVAGIAATQNAAAKIWRVNNNPGKSCNFTTLTAALRSAQVAVGDTLHIEGSVTEYGKDGQTAANCDTVSKRLVIIGPGYLLNDNAETQHNKESAKVRTLHIASAAAGTIIAGIEQARPTSGTNYINGYSLLASYKKQWNVAYEWGVTPGCYKLRIEANNVTISHSKLYYVHINNASKELSNITITKNFFNPGVISTSGNNSVTNLIISNNFFRNDYNGANYWVNYTFDYLVIDLRGDYAYTGNHAASLVYDIPRWPVVQPTIQNNTFYYYANLAVKAARLYNNVFFFRNNETHSFGLPIWPGVAEHDTKNNVIATQYASTWANPTAQTAPWDYTKNYGGMLNNVNGNQYSNVAETSWFASSSTLPALDKSFVLASGSPARDASGEAVRQRGMYGGLAPYVLSGLYTIPAVWSITIPSYPSGEVPSTGFEVQVKVKSH
jgi:hypothetical protein